MIQMVVFDMAGTTVNENNLVYRTLQQSITEAGFPVSLEQVLTLGAGKEKLQAVRDILGEGESESRAVEIHQHFVQRLANAYEQADVSAFADCEAVFASLRERQIKVVLNTGYAQGTAQQLLNILKWEEGQQIDLLVTADQVTNSRPHPDMIHLAMQKMAISDPASVAKIGDSIIDIEEGKSAACGLTFGVTTGAHSRAQLESAQPDYVVDSLSEMMGLL